ncbi:hypothetical protein KDA_29940 [Dictyobacter alpinus]|uniref:Macroglobulin domain-containing protein n=2 Tax=Dictyobacter alpinus TaxID=2014873 RepID=A0A402B889_9CHLR|nr:hypothetical protein KDA_29940 [Dictyobacter alpinus]
MSALLLTILFSVSACGPTIEVNKPKPQPTVTIKKSFQQGVPSVPKFPSYVCGSWSSANNPGTYSVISIYARLTQNTKPVAGMSAQATAHFKYGDVNLDQAPVSDSGGYVTFYLQLQGRQPRQQAATVDVSFNVNGKTISCTPAFFAPQ